MSQRIPWSTAHPLINGKWDEGYMGGGARLLSFLKLSFLYVGAIDFVNIRIQPLTISVIIIIPIVSIVVSVVVVKFSAFFIIRRYECFIYANVNRVRFALHMDFSYSVSFFYKRF